MLLYCNNGDIRWVWWLREKGKEVKVLKFTSFLKVEVKCIKNLKIEGKICHKNNKLGVKSVIMLIIK